MTKKKYKRYSPEFKRHTLKLRAAFGCHFNQSMQHMRQIVLPGSRSLTFCEVAR